MAHPRWHHLQWLAALLFGLTFGYNLTLWSRPSPTCAPTSPSATHPEARTEAEIDTFATYSYRTHPSCNISSPSLLSTTSPICLTRSSLLTSLSSGGRPGFDAPYHPHSCSMRWLSTPEICAILSRFARIIVVGDSMMRHLVGALNVLLREDLGYGAVTNWNFSPEEYADCFCNHQFDVRRCSLQGIFRTGDVLANDPASLKCAAGQEVDLVIEMMLKWPLVPEEVKRYTELIEGSKPRKPYAFVYGHGLWNDLDLQATLNWLDDLTAATVTRAPYLQTTLFHRLFISPSAAGPLKPDQFIVSQGDKALQLFEESTRQEVGRRGFEHLGTWNMSIQANKYDGVHLDLRGNLLKAMMLVNWLGMLEVGGW
jgi:hypothetical protein